MASFVERHKFFGWEEEGYDFEKMCGDGYFLGNLGGERVFFRLFANVPPELYGRCQFTP